MTEMNPEMAVLNITFRRQSGSMPDMVSFDLDDESIKRMATEAINAGGVPGIDRFEATEDDFEYYTVDRFEAKDDLPCRLFMRPKSPVGLR